MCLEELGGCTVLGCDAKSPKAPTGPQEEIRARIRQRVARYREGLTLPQDDTKEVQQRLADQPPFCVACERELLTRSCPACDGSLLTECGGDSVHCARLSCRSYYAKIAKTQGTPIQGPDPAKRTSRLLLVGLGLAAAVVLVLASILSAMLGGPASMPFALIAVGLGAILFLIGPLLIMMIDANKRCE